MVDASEGAAKRGLLRSYQLLTEDAEALNQLLDQLELEIDAGTPLNCSRLRGKPLALWRRAFQRWLLACQLSDVLSAASVDQLLEAAFAGKYVKISAGAKRSIVFEEGVLSLQFKEEPIAWEDVHCPAGVLVFLPTGYQVSIELVTLTHELREHILAGALEGRDVAYLDAGQVTLPLAIRRWEPGDRYRPLGAPGSRKLQDIFTDAKIASAERKSRPLVCEAKKNICWCPGLAPAEFAKITPRTASALKLTYRAT